MSHYQKLIAYELKKLNTKIDRRIVRGLPYKDLAAQHRALIAKMA